MRYYFAPMEGVTGYVFRRAHHRFFPGVDRYYMPFVSPTKNHVLTHKELQDLAPAHNDGIPVVPQLLTKCAEDFLWAAGELAQRGYDEVNLNLGCPFGTVVSKGKGAGFLASPALLERFLEEIFTKTPLRISIKTRLGIASAEEFPPLLEIFSRFPVAELTVHPRVQRDMYKNRPQPDAFERALAVCRCPVCYNGDLVTAADCAALAARFPSVSAVMLGRGLVANPALLSRVRGGGGADSATLEAFHDALYEGYCEAFGSARNALFRMKEVWFYMIHLFAGSEQYAKKLKKTTDPREYAALTHALFRDLVPLPDAVAGWQ